MRSRSVSFLAAVAGAAVGVALALGPGAAAVPGSDDLHFWDVTPYGAPPDAKGGIGGPQVDCADGSEAVVDWTLTNVATDEAKDFHFVGYDVPFLRVPVAHYRSRTVASCGDVTESRTERVVVWQKNARNTISQAEFNRLRKGMTRAEVARIVGYPGQAGPSYPRYDVQVYDHLEFAAQAQIDFRNDKAVHLFWLTGVGG